MTASIAKRAACLLPSVMALLLPKCPLCVAAWAGLFGTAGLDLATYQRWLLPFSGLLLATSACLIVRKTEGNARIAAISGLIAATELILAGRLWLESHGMTIAGGVIFIATAIGVAYRPGSVDVPSATGVCRPPAGCSSRRGIAVHIRPNGRRMDDCSR